MQAINGESLTYHDTAVRQFTIMAVVWGVVGMLVGVIIAAQLVWPELNLGLPWTSFGRLRPLHTNAVIFAFGGCTLFATAYFVVQRTSQTSLFMPKLASFTFWGWQLVIVAAAISLPLGYTQGKEYAELEWPIDVLIAVVWVSFAIVFFGTIAKRKIKHIFVANWFFGAFIIAVALLHIVNSAVMPVSFMKSYSAYAGVQDAMVQWWYGHNAVGFFLTAGFLGIMYYFVPKQAERPIYSYSLSIVHFWALIFTYMWAGPHHLHYTALPDWTQSLGMVFSLVLLAPSWGGMINGVMTLSGAWHKLRTDPILRFMIVSLSFYGMSTFEGPMMSIKTVNALSHYTDWTIGHVHIGTLGWNGMMTFGILYWLLPRIFNTKLYSAKLANTHFWIGTLGILFYAVPLYWAGWTQSLMWKQFTADGFLQYGNFLETVTQILPMYALRALGGTLYLGGVFVMVYNLYKTVKGGNLEANEAVEAPAREVYVKHKGEHWHRWIERRPVQMLIGSTILVLIGGMVELFPMMMVEENVPKIASVSPYSPLELEGRDLYIREGCLGCHSQMIRPFRSETERYGEYSKSGEFIYDRPFLWGSKRTGPDLHRVGAKYPDSWHYNHMLDPESMSPGSIMPPYPWMLRRDLNTDYTAAKIKVLQQLGTPYPEGYADQAVADLKAQAAEIAKSLRGDGIEQEGLENKEIIALIAYLQRLGTDIKPKPQADN